MQAVESLQRLLCRTQCARTSGAVFADLDNNGTLELYVANNAKQSAGKAQQKPAQAQHSQLFRNDAGKLTDVSVVSGACPESLFTARNVGVLDYDGDGLLDLLIVEDKFTKAPRSVLVAQSRRTEVYGRQRSGRAAAGRFRSRSRGGGS